MLVYVYTHTLLPSTLEEDLPSFSVTKQHFSRAAHCIEMSVDVPISISLASVPRVMCILLLHFLITKQLTEIQRRENNVTRKINEKRLT